MNDTNQISSNLISCRNILLGGRSNDNVLECLKNVLAGIGSISVPSTREIVERCVGEAIRQVDGSSFVSAGKILNLIHNLPLTAVDEKRWDIDYFLSMEFPAFLEDYEEVVSARAIALCVCKHLGTRYLAADDC